MDKRFRTSTANGAVVEFGLVRHALLAKVAAGQLRCEDICDAHPELLRAARNSSGCASQMSSQRSWPAATLASSAWRTSPNSTTAPLAVLVRKRLSITGDLTSSEMTVTAQTVMV